MQNLTQNGSRTWKDHLAPSICTSPLNVAFWIEFCWRASIAPRYKQQTTLQGLLLRFGTVRWESPRSPEKHTTLRCGHVHFGTHHQERCPKGQISLGFQWICSINNLPDHNRWQRGMVGNTHWHSEWSYPPELPPWPVSAVTLRTALSRFVYKGILLSHWKNPLNNNGNVVICYWHTSSQPLPSFPHIIRSNAAWDWFVQRAKEPKRLGTAEFTLNLGGGKMSRAGTKGIQ